MLLENFQVDVANLGKLAAYDAFQPVHLFGDTGGGIMPCSLSSSSHTVAFTTYNRHAQGSKQAASVDASVAVPQTL